MSSRHKISCGTRSTSTSKITQELRAPFVSVEKKPGVMGESTTVVISGFPKLKSASRITRGLEKYTGKWSIEALRVRKNDRGKVYATVQFTTRDIVDEIKYLEMKNKLCFDERYLEVQERDIVDLVPKPKKFLIQREGVTVHFGCQVSEDRFSVLGEMKEAMFKFRFGLKELYLCGSHGDMTYKLQLSNQNISQIQLHCPRRSKSKFLVIKLLYGARIYEKIEDDDSFYHKDPPNDRWVRSTDVTPSRSIGQSSHICIELPLDEELEFIDESYHRFELVTGESFSGNADLVPIVSPTRDLTFDILFKICSLVQLGCIPGPVLDDNFYRLLDPRSRKHTMFSIEHVMEKLSFHKGGCYDPVEFITKQYQKDQWDHSPAIVLGDGLVYVRRVEITPTKVYFCGPEVNRSNMVLRKFDGYVDNFLRVSFLDEGSKLFSRELLSPTQGTTNRIYDRIRSILRDGIEIGNKKFEFLAFSTSQLRDASVWMFASTDNVDADYIRRWMGDFSRIKNVAKYAARLGQSFSSSKESVIVKNVDKILDITSGSEYVFSDGIGKISPDLAKEVAGICGYDPVTSAFQIRYGGYKGVVAVDPNLSGKILSLRESMRKFESNNKMLNILASSRYQACYLNRQYIILLSTLGIPDEIFEKKQKQETDILNCILSNADVAKNELHYLMPPGDNRNIISEMLSCGYKPGFEPFLSMMLQVCVEKKFTTLRTKSKIYVRKGRSMIGCLDETGILNSGEVFVQYSTPGTSRLRTLKGGVVVAKNPCLHPGDVRLLKAINVPELQHMVDCIVFPQRGERPHPNECSGSDLDGDVYFVCWDPALIPTRHEDPMDYTPRPSMQLYHNVTIQEVQEYFTDYIVNDNLGIIANAHTVFADKERGKARAEICVELAELHSTAVDFPKSGVPAVIRPSHRPKEYPDFMEKPNKPSYKSKNVLGKLFRQVKDIAPPDSPLIPFTKAVAREAYDADMEAGDFKSYTRRASDMKELYDLKLGNLMDYYGIKTEAEVLIGTIIRKSESFKRKNDAEAISAAVMSLRKEARGWFKTWIRNSDAEDGNVYAKASACYHVTYHHAYCSGNNRTGRPHFLSFPWCFHDKLIQIKSDNAEQQNYRIPRHR